MSGSDYATGLILVALVVLFGWIGIQNVATPQSRIDVPPTAYVQTPQPRRGLETATVIRVIDGDTVMVRLENGVIRTVRLLGIDTPETKDARKAVQCYGPEATAYTTKRLSGQTVTLVADKTQGDNDIYGRALRYIWIGNTLFQRDLLRYGYGREYTYKTAYRYQDEFRALEARAKGRKLGVWGCNPPPWG